MIPKLRTAGPHIESRDSVRRSMWEVTVALLPLVIAATLFFGPYSLYLIFASAIASAMLERPFAPGGFSLNEPLGDGSAFLAGMLFGLTLAPGSPWWIPFFGAVIIVFVAKQAFGGIGNNIFNPALVARALLLLFYPGLSTGWRSPLDYDAIASATPLETMSASYLDLFLGNVAGSIGEVSVLALLIGAVYLFARGYVGWRISVGYLGAAMLTAMLLGIDPLYTIMSGSIMFAALFMSTDMVTSPVGRSARSLYGIGCGVLTVLLREYTMYPEGTTFAVLFMNGVTPLIDTTLVDTFFGEVKKRRRRIAALAAAALVLIIGFAAGSSRQLITDSADSLYVNAVVRHDMRLFFPEARHALSYESSREGVQVEQIYLRTEPLGYLVYSSAPGYRTDVSLVTALDMDERIIGMRIIDHQESATLGALIRRPSFLNQFLRRSTANPDIVVEELHAISGATVSSRAVAEAVREGLSFRIADEPDGPRLDLAEDGSFRGSGQGYGGRIEIEARVSGGRLEAIEVLSHSETSDIGEPVLARIADAVISQQSLQVDAVSGATGSSRGMIAAIRDALGQ